MKTFNGKVICLDRSDINTDEIIPARYLTEIEKKSMGPHLMEDLKLDGFDPATDLDGISVMVSRENFGCGSSREHAPWALEANGINVVIAESFARIFRQNMFNCGMLAISLSKADIETVFSLCSQGDAHIGISPDLDRLTIRAGDETRTMAFEISEFDRQLIRAGGWVEYADQNY